MTKYNSSNFNRYKKDVKSSQPNNKDFYDYKRDELIIKFLPLVENIARNFKHNEAASGVLTLSDAIQFGNVGLIKAVDKLQWQQILSSKDPERTLKSYFAKRIRGAIRRAIDANRSGMRIPEHKLNEIRKDFDNQENAAIFFNSMFESIDIEYDEENSFLFQIEDKSEDPLKKEKLYSIIRDIMLKHLTDKEYHVIRLSYGLGCDKMSAKKIAEKLDIQGSSAYVRVSQLKRQAINKLKQVIKRSQVIDYL